MAVNDLKANEAVFAEFLNEAGHADKSHWKRTVQYSHLHLLFAQTIVSTLLAECDRRIVTQQPGIGAATSAAIRLAQGRFHKPETAIFEPAAPILEFRDCVRRALDEHSERNHARIDHGHELGSAIRGQPIIWRHLIVNGERLPEGAAGGLEPRYRWSQAAHWEFRARLIRAASAQRASEAIRPTDMGAHVKAQPLTSSVSSGSSLAVRSAAGPSQG
jgi:hypothetical protein